ncbi:MAG: TauD/TfdA family dioxygenase [Jatrophihabitantaceae bacterium]
MTQAELSLPNYLGRLSGSTLHEAMEAGDGLATFDCESEQAFVEAALDYGVVMPHRDADARGVTHLRSVPRPGKERALGFSNDALLPHTDRPAIKAPPRVLLLWCRTGSAEGGETTLLRGSDVADRLGELDPTALQAFTADDAAIFRTGSDEHVGPILRIENGVFKEVRLRFDPSVYFAVNAARRMPSLMRALAETEQVFRLSPGKGYAVRNDLWLHGRRSFSGDRELFRIMIASPHRVSA